MAVLRVLEVNGVEDSGLRVVKEISRQCSIFVFLDDRSIVVDHAVIVVVQNWLRAYSQLRSR